MAELQRAEIDELRDGRGPTDGSSGHRPWYRRRRVLLIGVAALLALVVGGAFYYHRAAGYESTDDAFIDGEICGSALACPATWRAST